MPYISSDPQEHLWLRLILNLSANIDEGTPCVNDTTDREVATKSTKFGRAVPHILQEIWEVDLKQGPARIPKFDVTKAYH